jgi:ribosomal protein S18 acetylase RimI-like enzyme
VQLNNVAITQILNKMNTTDMCFTSDGKCDYKEEPLPRDIIKKPEIDSAIRDFGKKPDDFCLFAELNGKTVGGAWMRISDDEPKSYGHIDSETPELAIAVFKPYQKLGIGRELMRHLIDSAFKKYKQLSLSVDKRNYAVKMYKELGFEIVKENEQDYVMVLKSHPYR